MARPTFIAWHNLVSEGSRTAIALAGVSFTLLAMILQLGFLEATLRTATIVLETLDFDVVIVSRHYHYLADAGTFPLPRVRQAVSIPQVKSAVPLYVRSGTWRNLGRPAVAGEPWQRRPILVLSCDPNERAFRASDAGGPAGLDQYLNRLVQPATLLVDERSRWEFGPQDQGTPVQINRERFAIGGRFAMGTGFAADGAALLGHRNFARAFGSDALKRPTLGLIRVDDPSRADAVARRLRAVLPVQDVRVFTRDEVERRERSYWVREKAIGSLFVMGVAISFLVGLVVVYQVLSSDIADHLAEYATLKAIGHTTGRIRSIVVQQGLILGIVGYALALILSVPLYMLVEAWAKIPLSLVWWILLWPAILACTMTTGSALLSIRKVAEADPADLFR